MADRKQLLEEADRVAARQQQLIEEGEQGSILASFARQQDAIRCSAAEARYEAQQEELAEGLRRLVRLGLGCAAGRRPAA